MREIEPQIVGQEYDSALINQSVNILFRNSDIEPAINGIREMTQYS